MRGVSVNKGVNVIELVVPYIRPLLLSSLYLIHEMIEISRHIG